ncbi:MAG: hypothetical protein QOD77_82 [Thermoplasmata archaeon]|jgi:hypothetical protein|nr:hypothetical protein [Thermoplasmata archaeon]
MRSSRLAATFVSLALALFLMSGSLGATLRLPGQVAQAMQAESDAQPLLGHAQQQLELVRAAADRLDGPGPLSDALAATAGIAVPAPLPPSASLAEALSRLAAVAGLPADVPQPAGFAALPAEAQDAVRRMVDGILEADRLLTLAYAGLTPEEAAFLRANILLLDQPGALDHDAQQEELRAEMLAARVDASMVRAAGLALVAAVEAIPPLPAAAPLPTLGGPSTTGVGGLPPLLPGPTPITPNACSASTGSSIVDPTGMIEVGLATDNSYHTERVGILDLGGNDCYENHPASFGPGTPLLLPVSVIVEPAGNDNYVSADPHPGSPPGTTWASGVGIGGIGLVMDRWGDDRHTVSLNNDASNCASYAGSSNTWQRIYGQGVGILGVGGLVDADGNDGYVAVNTNALNDAFCHWGRVYTFAQGLGARAGIGFLVDEAGDDRLTANAFAQGKNDNNAHVHAQGVAAARGLGLLFNAEGHDSYDASSQAYIGPLAGTEKGTFAYTFAQASLYGANEPRLEQLGAIATNAVTTGPAALCTAVVRVPTATGGVVDAGLPCDFQAVALLVDVMGQDRYNAWSDSSDLGRGCSWAAWAGVSAQGSAPTKGLASLLDGSADEDNAFDIHANANGIDCSTLGVRSAVYGQGFGGAILWDHWDAPPFDPLILTDAAVGLLLRAGACDGPRLLIPPVGTTINLAAIMKTVDVARRDPCDSSWSDDTYVATSTATNGGARLAWAQAFVQGAGNAHTGYTFFGNPVDYDALGIGLTADAAGNDGYFAQTATNSGGGTEDSFTVAQGASVGGIGVLANVFDDDSYIAEALEGGGLQPGDTVAQADTRATPIVVTVCVPPGGGLFCSVNTLNLAVGILVDVFGDDYYSTEFFYVVGPCPTNGLPLPAVPHFWGNTVPLGSVNCPNPPGLVLGMDTT